MNIAAALYRVNQPGRIAGLLLALWALCKFWFTHGVELGKDEAAYWFWSLNWDFSYAPLPFAVYRLAHACAPGVEWSLRLGPMAAGVIASVLMFRWCRGAGLDVERSLWATAAFATSHWIWHTGSFLHPDGFLVPCWLLVLVCARAAAARHWARRACVLLGVAAALAVYCKYSGALLAASLFLWLFVTTPRPARGRALGYSLVPFAICLAPLVQIQWVDDFRLPLALGSLSRIASDTSVVVRLGLFAVGPLLYVSPLLLWLLYRTLASVTVAAGNSLRQAPVPEGAIGLQSHRHLLLMLIPAAAVLLCFGFFALYRGQVKGNWILPAFLALWPCAFGARAMSPSSPAPRRPGSRFLTLAIAIGLVQTAAAGLALKYPGAAGNLMLAIGGGRLDDSYPQLVSAVDRRREPTLSWRERSCEYSGWRPFTRSLETALDRAGLPASTALVSTQYDVVFTTAFYADVEAERRVYTVADPRFRRLSDLGTATPRPDTLLFISRAGAALPEEVGDYEMLRLPQGTVFRATAGCDPVTYDLTLLIRTTAVP